MISIIIPLYNLCGEGRFLQKCLDSLLAQSFNDFEVLLMENGSTDDTVEVAKGYCEQDKRFKLHILTEKGIANARNEGLKAASGDFICFIDGDDFVSTDFLQTLFDTINLESNIDIAVVPCKLYNIKNGITKDFTSDYNPRIISDGNIAPLFSDGMVWAKLYRHSVIKEFNILFDKSLYGVDDVLFSSEMKLTAKKIAISNKGVYYYIQGRNGQASASKMTDSANSHLLLVTKLEELFKKYNKYEDYKGYIDKIFISIFTGYDFALTPLAKMNNTQINEIISLNYNKIINIIPDETACPKWQIKWYNRFKKAVKKGKGAFCIKFMRKYRNIILQPLGIKYKGDKFINK